MDLDDESNFGPRREATSGHIRMDLDARSGKAAGQKGLSGEVHSFLTGCQ